MDSPKVETQQHMDLVKVYAEKLVDQIFTRGLKHDISKFSKEEWPIFERETPLLKTLTYGSEEYKASLERLGPALAHHYQSNRHHPQHFKDGVAGMNLVDLCEMFCDWVAASQRGKDGDPMKGIEISCKRFDMPPMLEQIFKNTVEVILGKVQMPTNTTNRLGPSEEARKADKG